MSEPRAWEVVKGMVTTPSGSQMRASCHHRKVGACGGCYARLYLAIEQMHTKPETVQETYDAVIQATKEEIRFVITGSKRRTKKT